jgi:Uma2 family endonuclease
VSENAHLRIQLPLTLTPLDEPYPDIAVVPGSPRDYKEHHPTHALLVVEIAEASLKTDREVKGSLYASVGIPEYWLVNLKAGEIEVYRDPTPNPRAPYGASYRTVLRLGKEDTITPVARPEVRIAVAELLP